MHVVLSQYSPFKIKDDCEYLLGAYLQVIEDGENIENIAKRELPEQSGYVANNFSMLMVILSQFACQYSLFMPIE